MSSSTRSEAVLAVLGASPDQLASLLTVLSYVSVGDSGIGATLYGGSDIAATDTPHNPIVHTLRVQTRRCTFGVVPWPVGLEIGALILAGVPMPDAAIVCPSHANEREVRAYTRALGIKRSIFLEESWPTIRSLEACVRRGDRPVGLARLEGWLGQLDGEYAPQVETSSGPFLMNVEAVVQIAGCLPWVSGYVSRGEAHLGDEVRLSSVDGTPLSEPRVISNLSTLRGNQGETVRAGMCAAIALRGVNLNVMPPQLLALAPATTSLAVKGCRARVFLERRVGAGSTLLFRSTTDAEPWAVKATPSMNDWSDDAPTVVDFTWLMPKVVPPGSRGSLWFGGERVATCVVNATGPPA